MGSSDGCLVESESGFRSSALSLLDGPVFVDQDSDLDSRLALQPQSRLRIGRPWSGKHYRWIDVGTWLDELSLVNGGLHDLGLAVNYPGLTHHPDHELISELHCPDYGYGGILTLDTGCEDKANALMDMLQNDYRFGYMAVSLGYYDTLMSCSGSTTSSEMTDEDKATAGIAPGLIRMSVGFTGTAEQRWRQMHAALRRLGMVSGGPHTGLEGGERRAS